MRTSLSNRSAAFIALLAAATAPAQGTPPSFPLTREAVAAAVQSAGLAASPPQVQLPLSISARISAPALEVTSADLLPDGHTRVRLACSHQGECLPFFVTLVRAGTPDSPAAIEALNARLRAQSSPQGPHGPLLRVGEHATLLIEDPRMRIELPVVSIDSGALGAEVRVSSLDRKNTFRGTVVAPAIVKANLP